MSAADAAVTGARASSRTRARPARRAIDAAGRCSSHGTQCVHRIGQEVEDEPRYDDVGPAGRQVGGLGDGEPGPRVVDVEGRPFGVGLRPVDGDNLAGRAAVEDRRRQGSGPAAHASQRLPAGTSSQSRNSAATRRLHLPMYGSYAPPRAQVSVMDQLPGVASRPSGSGTPRGAVARRPIGLLARQAGSAAVSMRRPSQLEPARSAGQQYCARDGHRTPGGDRAAPPPDGGWPPCVPRRRVVH